MRRSCRPSIIFGDGDSFFNRFAAMARVSPVLPVVRPETKFQPIYVDDVAAAVEVALKGEAQASIFELGGPEVMSFRELLKRMLGVIRRRRMILAVPGSVARVQGRFFDALQRWSYGIFTNGILTQDQVAMLGYDNVVAEGARGLADLGLSPTAMDAVLDSYLYAYRPRGQYSEMQESISRLRG